MFKKRKKKHKGGVVEQATAAPGEKRELTHNERLGEAVVKAIRDFESRGRFQ